MASLKNKYQPSLLTSMNREKKTRTVASLTVHLVVCLKHTVLRAGGRAKTPRAPTAPVKNQVQFPAPTPRDSDTLF